MCSIKGYVVKNPQISFLTSMYLYDRICRFFIVKCSDKQYVKDVYPIVCFGDIASDVMKIEEGDVINIKGIIKDYNYKDYNLTTHRTKVIIASSIEKLNKEMIDYTSYEKVYDELIKNNINIIDLSEFDRLERKFNDKKEVIIN